MSYLYKTLWGVGLIILIELLQKFFDRIFPEAGVFHHNFLSAVQVVILLWTMLRLLPGPVSSGKTFRKNFLVLFLVLAIPELVFTYWLHHPSRIPSFLIPSFRYHYSMIQRNIIQFNPGCSIYDSSLFYTLKPTAGFVYTNYEFSDSFYTNKFGLRDDDNSLLTPGIICLGDSYAMGWGVQQSETFAELLSQRSGKKVLNAAISSYGTARELKNLYRLDTTNLQYLIIQYNPTDLMENAQFVQENYSLQISPERKYDSLVNMHRWSKLWFPGKHFITMSKFYAKKKMLGLLPVKEKGPSDPSPIRLHQSALYFTDILLHSAINFKKTKVYVLDVNGKELINDDFLNEVKALAGAPHYKEHFNDNLIMVPLADLLNRTDYYILDDHLRVSGHQKIAERLYNYMFR